MSFDIAAEKKKWSWSLETPLHLALEQKAEMRNVLSVALKTQDSSKVGQLNHGITESSLFSVLYTRIFLSVEVEVLSSLVFGLTAKLYVCILVCQFAHWTYF